MCTRNIIITVLISNPCNIVIVMMMMMMIIIIIIIITINFITELLYPRVYQIQNTCNLHR